MKKSLLLLLLPVIASFSAMASGHIASITVNQNVSCFGLSDGMATASVTGGTGPFTYMWSNGTPGNVISSVPAGNYYCIVTDNSDSSVDTAFCTITQPSQINAVATNNGPVCAGQTINLTSTGGTTYNWAGPNGFTSTAQNPGIINSTSAMSGVYTVTVTVGSCTASATTSVTVNANPVITAASNSPVCEGSAINLFATGTFTYSWVGPNAFVSNSANPLISFATIANSGTYTVTGTDANGCVSTTTLNVVVMPVPFINVTSTDASCNGVCNGLLTANVSGGTQPYTYMWSPGGGTTPVTSGLCAGAYTVTVTDNMGCVSTSFGIVNQPSPITTSLSSTAASGCSACDGSITGNVTGGTPAYTYSWSGPNGFTAATSTINNLCSSNYTLQVTDANGCTATNNATVSNSSMNIAVNVTADSCNSGAGSATVVVTGNQGNVTYNWLPGGSTTQAIFGLSAGTYTVTATDTTGCSVVSLATISNANSPTVVTTSSAANCGAPNGFIAASASGGSAPYLFSFNGGTFSSNSSVNNLLPGTHTVTVQDANGCQASTTQVVLNSGLSATVSVTHASCNNNTSGSATATPTSGTSPYTYLWSNGATTQTITNILNGQYSCVITDAGGCSTTVYAYIGQYSSMYVYFGYTYFNCGNNSLTANVYAGTGPYTYLWAPGGQTTQTISNVPNGTYTVTVTDVNGCTGTGIYQCYPYSYSLITGNLFADANGNCVNDGGDYPLNYWYVTAQATGGNYYGGSWSGNGNYTIYVPNTANTYTITPTPGWGQSSSYYNLTCPLTNTVTTTGNCDTTVVDLPMTVTPAQDLKAYLYCGPARPGFTRWYTIQYSNPGTIAMSGTVEMDIDPLYTFTGSTPPPTLVSGSHIEWDFTNLQPATWSQNIYVSATLPATVALGTPVKDSVRIEPVAGDVLVTNNYSSCNNVVVGSYDPNEKEVYSPQADQNGAIDTSGAELFYTVHFQNTGTDTAFTIVVRDTLSPFIDLTSLEMLGASHNYSWNIQPGRCLTVTFNNILLVDSNMNEPMSHGFFHYKVHTVSDIAAGDMIDNTAGIYFDFNAPVITNTVTTPVTISTGVASHNQLNADVYPNPSSTGMVRVKLNAASYNKISFILFDSQGRIVKSKNISTAQLFDVDLHGLSEGIYFYKVSNDKGEQSSGKIIVGK